MIAEVRKDRKLDVFEIPRRKEAKAGHAFSESCDSVVFVAPPRADRRYFAVFIHYSGIEYYSDSFVHWNTFNSHCPRVTFACVGYAFNSLLTVI